MATELENLRAARAGAIAKLAAAMTDTKSAGGKPNTNAANSVDHMGYVRELNALIADLNSQITMAEGPWEIISEVET